LAKSSRQIISLAGLHYTKLFHCWRIAMSCQQQHSRFQ